MRNCGPVLGWLTSHRIKNVLQASQAGQIGCYGCATARDSAHFVSLTWKRSCALLTTGPVQTCPMENRLDLGIASEVEGKRTEIESLCRRTNVLSLDLFGSATSRAFRPEASDLDFVVTFAEFPQGGIFDAYMDLAEGLEALFSRKVDLVTERSIRNPYFRKAVEASRVRIYDRRNSQAPV
jgi:predicted nucleotidyltransferase